jgi:hypothetical protein
MVWALMLPLWHLGEILRLIPTLHIESVETLQRILPGLCDLFRSRSSRHRRAKLALEEQTTLYTKELGRKIRVELLNYAIQPQPPY